MSSRLGLDCATKYVRRHLLFHLASIELCPYTFCYLFSSSFIDFNIVSGSATPVFHMEMAVYHLKPSYDYQELAWKTHIWKKNQNEVDGTGRRGVRRKFHFKEIARAVKFTSKLFGKALSKRIKATILYATETGKSELFARRLCEIFGHAFNAHVKLLFNL